MDRAAKDNYSTSTKILVAISGGVDSSVAAALLLEAGYNCAGVFMITNDDARHALTDARTVADKLGIELHVLDLREQFRQVLCYFGSEYGAGRTPNPCVFCNRLIKFGRLMDFARNNGADLLATGHYAQICANEGEAGLYEAVQADKDQSYVLAQIERSVLPSVRLPMGTYGKTDTRRIASEFGLHTADKADSQEICFIPDDDYVRVLEEHYPSLARSGDIIDSSGKVLGRHGGIHRFTIGQRRGLGIAMGTPYYVSHIDAGRNTVTLGPKAEVMHRTLMASGVNWLMSPPSEAFRARIRIRYNDRGAGGVVTSEGDRVKVRFDQPRLAITPGQLAVFYIEESGRQRVAGSAWIDSVGD